jgi:dipicolinate synthase subunit B
MSKLRLGLAMTGSFCTFEKVLACAQDLCRDYDVTPIMSQNAYELDTRFGSAESFRTRLEEMTGKEIIHTLPQAEPIGPKKLLDVLFIAPCTGSTMAKIAHGISDTAVTMAAKSHMRNGGSVLIAVSTNDGLSGSAANIGALLSRKNIYFLPFYQDDPVNKPSSLAADYALAKAAIESAYLHRQLQPVLSSRLS